MVSFPIRTQRLILAESHEMRHLYLTAGLEQYRRNFTSSFGARNYSITGLLGRGKRSMKYLAILTRTTIVMCDGQSDGQNELPLHILRFA